jgi:hypothetical protein
MMMWITRQVIKWLEKWGTGQTEQPLIPEHIGYSTKLKSLQDLGIKFESMVIKEVVDDAGLWVDGGTQHRRFVSRWRNATSLERIPIPPSCVRYVRSPPPVVDFPEISSQNSNQWCRREWEGRRPSPLSWVRSHHKHECDWTLKLRVTPTSPTPPAYRWRCHHRPWSYDLWFVQDCSSTARPCAKKAQRTKTATSSASCCQ